MKKTKIRKYSPMWYIKKYWIVATFYTIVGIGIQALWSYGYQLYADSNTPTQEVVIKEVKELKPYIPPQPKIEIAVVPTPKETPHIGNQYFSRGSYTERREYLSYKYTKNDIELLASILEAECPSESHLPDWDRRLEANVILNRHIYHGGSLQSIIEAGNGRQFNGIRTKTYKNRDYSEESWDAAYAVLILGERVLDEDIRYFTNIYTATDKNFVDSIDWVLKQTNKYGHSFGRVRK